MNGSWLVQEERALVAQYQRVRARFEQLQREWTVVPFHWSEVDVAYLHRVALAFEALAGKEADWRMVQYNLHWGMFRAHEHDPELADYAELAHAQATTYLRECQEWRQEATESRLFRQAADRARATYLAYQEHERVTLAAYQAKIGGTW